MMTATETPKKIRVSSTSEHLVSPGFSQLVMNRLHEMDWSITDLWKILMDTFQKPHRNHLYRICNGTTSPSENQASQIAAVLELDLDVVLKTLKKDMAIRRGITDAISDIDPQFLGLETAWSLLDDEGKDRVKEFMQMELKRRKGHVT